MATKSKYTLQEYLNTELNLTQHFCDNDISVSYYDSKKFYLLQLADFISNTFYRRYQKNIKEADENVEVWLKQMANGKVYWYPL